ncbi:MAG: class I SAM-dependent methyltransferase [Spirochaetales bacterium]
MLALLVTVLAFVVLVAGLILVQLHTLRVPPMPSNPRMRAAILTLLTRFLDGIPPRAPGPAAEGADPSGSRRRPSCRVYELGSGWGGLSVRIAREYPDIPVVGVERSVVPYLFSRIMLAVFRQPNLSFRRLDVHAAPFESPPDRRNEQTPVVLIAYLSREHMDALAAALPARRRITVISAAFALPGRQPDEEIRVQDLYRTPVYRYDL